MLNRNRSARPINTLYTFTRNDAGLATKLCRFSTATNLIQYSSHLELSYHILHGAFAKKRNIEFFRISILNQNFQLTGLWK